MIQTKLCNYELFIMTSADIPAQGVRSIHKKISELSLKNCHGSIKKVEYIGVRKLAYKIKKYSKARCYIVYFSTKPTNISQISSYLNINDGVVRSLITKIDAIPSETPAIVLQNKQNITSDDKDYQKAGEGPFSS